MHQSVSYSSRAYFTLFFDHFQRTYPTLFVPSRRRSSLLSQRTHWRSLSVRISRYFRRMIGWLQLQPGEPREDSLLAERKSGFICWRRTRSSWTIHIHGCVAIFCVYRHELYIRLGRIPTDKGTDCARRFNRTEIVSRESAPDVIPSRIGASSSCEYAYRDLAVLRLSRHSFSFLSLSLSFWRDSHTTREIKRFSFFWGISVSWKEDAFHFYPLASRFSFLILSLVLVFASFQTCISTNFLYSLDC